MTLKINNNSYKIGVDEIEGLALLLLKEVLAPLQEVLRHFLGQVLNS